MLTDWQMPGSDGIELIHRIRKKSDTAFTCVILLTGQSATENIVMVMDNGPDAYLIKTADTGDLRARIQARHRIVRLERRLEMRRDAAATLQCSAAEAMHT